MGSPIPSPPPDASGTRRGLVSLVAQTFAGIKTFSQGIALGAKLTITDVAAGTEGIRMPDGSLLVGGAGRFKAVSGTNAMEIDQGNISSQPALRIFNCGVGPSGIHLLDQEGGYMQFGRGFGSPNYVMSVNRSMEFVVDNWAHDTSPHAFNMTSQGGGGGSRNVLRIAGSPTQAGDLTQWFFKRADASPVARMDLTGRLFNAGLEPLVTNTSPLGSATKRFSNVHTHLLTFADGTSLSTVPAAPPTTTLASTGSGASLVKTGTGPGLVVKGINSGQGLKTVTGADFITLEHNLIAGAGVTLTDNGDLSTTISSPVTPTTTLTSPGPGSTLVQAGTGPSLSIKSLIPGKGIDFMESSDYISIMHRLTAGPGVTITDDIGAGTTTVAATGGKPLVGGTNITVIEGGSDVIIAGATLSASQGVKVTEVGTEFLFAHNLVAGTGVTLTDNGDKTTTIASPVTTLGSAGSGATLVNDGTGPDLAVKSIAVANTWLTITNEPTRIVIGVFNSGWLPCTHAPTTVLESRWREHYGGASYSLWSDWEFHSNQLPRWGAYTDSSYHPMIKHVGSTVTLKGVVKSQTLGTKPGDTHITQWRWRTTAPDPGLMCLFPAGSWADGSHNRWNPPGDYGAMSARLALNLSSTFLATDSTWSAADAPAGTWVGLWRTWSL